ncbi:MAG: GSCFA domain-containing protein [Alistipes sp.]
MKFRTEIKIAPFDKKIGHENHILSLGSCFAESVSARLAQSKFHVTTNPVGVLFNPLSISTALRSFADPAPLLASDLHQGDGLWFNYDFHGGFSDPSAARALDKMNAARQLGAQALHDADQVLLTFGTAWVFRHKGQVVANCHKRPSAEFVRCRLTVNEIVDEFSKLIGTILADKEVIFTVSPVRHINDGLDENFLSKATLKLAIAELTASFGNTHYFPAYEIITDDLRDYRYYADDLIHPAPQAIEYVWEKFAAAALSERAQQLLPQIVRITAAACHRPQYPTGAAYKTFCKKQLEQIATLPEIDFSTEVELFKHYTSE